MTDLAELGLRIESQQATKAAQELDKFTAAAGRAEAANDSLAGSSKDGAGAVEKLVDAAEKAAKGSAGLTSAQEDVAEAFVETAVTGGSLSTILRGVVGALAPLAAPAAVVAGLAAVQWATEYLTNAENDRLDALKEAANISDQLVDINRSLASSSAAMAPVLRAEAAAIREVAAAARERAAAEGRRARAASEVWNPYAEDGGLAASQWAAQRAERLEGIASGGAVEDMLSGRINTRNDILGEINRAQAQLLRGFDNRGDRLSEASRMALEAMIQRQRASARQDISWWEQQQAQIGREIAASQEKEGPAFEALLNRARLIADGLDATSSIIIAGTPTDADLRSGRASTGRSSTSAEADRIAREAERAALEADRINRLRITLDLEDALAVAQAKGEKGAIAALERELTLLRLTQDYRSAGYELEVARAKALERIVAIERAAESRLTLPDVAYADVQMRDDLRAWGSSIKEVAGQHSAFRKTLRDTIAGATSEGLRDGLDGIGDFLGRILRQRLADALADNLTTVLMDFASTSKGGGGKGGWLGALAGLFVPGFANGTSFAPGGVARVGERGPEDVFLPRGSRVIPNHASRRARDDAPPQVVHVIVTADDRRFNAYVDVRSDARIQRAAPMIYGRSVQDASEASPAAVGAAQAARG